MINNTPICKTYLFKFVLPLYLTLLNFLAFLIVKKKCKLNFFYISQKFLLKKKKKISPKIWGLSLVGGLRHWPNRPRPRAGPGPETEGPFGLPFLITQFSVSITYNSKNMGPIAKRLFGKR